MQKLHTHQWKGIHWESTEVTKVDQEDHKAGQVKR